MHKTNCKYLVTYLFKLTNIVFRNFHLLHFVISEFVLRLEISVNNKKANINTILIKTRIEGKNKSVNCISITYV